jgi:TetR/AcrR family fatty acid metabolism transcriptional regulator
MRGCGGRLQASLPRDGAVDCARGTLVPCARPRFPADGFGGAAPTRTDRSPMEPMSSRETERSRGGRDKRQLILDAAIKVFARTGYHGSRVSDIAREAGIAYGLVYHYFKNKEEVLDTIFDEQWTAFIDAVETICDGGGSTEDKLHSVAALILNAYRVRRDWVKVLVFEIQRSPRFHDRDRLEAMGRLFGVVANVLAEAQKCGELRGDLDPRIASYLFVGGLDIVVTGRVLDVLHVEGDAGDESKYYLKVAHTVVDLFLNGMRPKEGGT